MKKRLLGWFVWISVKHLPPAPWQLSSDFQAEFEEKIIRETHYPINRNIFFLCNVAEKAEHQFYLQALEGNTFRWIRSQPHSRAKTRTDQEKEASQCLLETKSVHTTLQCNFE